ncbi:MAG: hypothetical protein QM777_07055 [Pseudorhodoferax sp.]
MVLPFVFRRYLDYNVFDALRMLHRQIREHAARRAAGHPERANDVKLSRGGIREIEFTVQLLQVVRGGQFPELRTRSTLDALPRLTRAGLMPQATAEALAQAYVFLRRVEHRIQYLDDQQTHVLPSGDEDLAWIAETMGYASCCPFLSELDQHREFVAQEFDILLGGDAKPLHAATATAAPRRRAAAPPDFDERAANACPSRFRQRIEAWRDHPRVQALRDESRGRLLRLVQRTADWLHGAGRRHRRRTGCRARCAGPTGSSRCCAARATWRCCWSARRCTSACCACWARRSWPARYLLRHPGVIDELASGIDAGRALRGRRPSSRNWRSRRAVAGPHRRGRRGGAAQPAAPRPPCRDVPHAGARRGGPADAWSRSPTTSARWPTPCCA